MRRFWRDADAISGEVTSEGDLNQIPGSDTRELVTTLPRGTYFLVTEPTGQVLLYRVKPGKMDMPRYRDAAPAGIYRGRRLNQRDLAAIHTTSASPAQVNAINRNKYR